MIDIVIGKRNEKIIQKNKERNLLFADYYASSLNYGDIDAVIIQTNDLKELGSRIAKVENKKKRVIIEGNSDLVNRFALENKKVFMLLSPEKIRKQDSLNSRNSGLNQVLCELAKKNNKIIGINIQDILNENKNEIEKARVIGRIMQNVRLCRKYKCRIILLSCSENPETKEKIKLIADSLGFSNPQIKDMENLIRGWG
jgi:RNase P/RNase MRP subunit p30